MKNYASQYRFLFLSLWILLYNIYPSWALPVSVNLRLLIFTSLLLYLSVSAYLIHHILKSFSCNKSLLIYPENPRLQLNNHLGLLILCLIAFLLHLYPITFPVILDGDEPAHLQGAVGIYLFLDSLSQRFTGLTAQYPSLILTAIVFLFIKSKEAKEFIKKVINSLRPYSIPIIVFLLFGYFFLMRDLPYHQLLVRYPPLAKIMYVISYLYTGINPVLPRTLQIIFYLAGAIYLYRSINLFRKKETALIGASIYLFSPLVFYFANFAELASGVVFFIIIISFYFLRYLRDRDDRDILLTSFLIGIGFFYKRDILLMLFICLTYLIIKWLYHRDFHLKLIFNLSLLSIIPVIPWLIIGKFFSERNYQIILSHLVSPEILFSYFLMIPTQLSWVMFFIFLASIVYFLLSKREPLKLHFALVFIFYYLFYVADVMERIHRFSLALYPAIAVFIALFISEIAERIKLKWPVFFIITAYLIAISTVWQAPPVEDDFVTYRNIKSRYFPVDKAMRWVKDNVKDGEKILILRVAPSVFYRDKYNIDRAKIIDFWYDLREFNTPQKLRTFCEDNNITYIMFSYGPAYPIDNRTKILEYLKENPYMEFAEIAVFSMDKNYIFVYKVN